MVPNFMILLLMNTNLCFIKELKKFFLSLFDESCNRILLDSPGWPGTDECPGESLTPDPLASSHKC